jgi:hydroxymethylglutaryl-CoA lyase
MGMGGMQIIECPRDAMQGWKHQIPTVQKIGYINTLLKVGFHTIDFGSFVSPKAIPQMADTVKVLEGLDLSDTKSKLLAIVANSRGAEDALKYEQISYLGFPFSISPTFQLRNTNSTIKESFERVKQIQDLCTQKNRQLVVYLSMGFGNPYGDEYNKEVLLEWADKMVSLGIPILSLADTVGMATADQISFALEALIPQYQQTVIGVHLHSSPQNFNDKLEAAVRSGCKRIDGALKGIGGCPMAQDDLVGNMNTEKIIYWLNQNNNPPAIDQEALEKSLEMASKIFS